MSPERDPIVPEDPPSLPIPTGPASGNEEPTIRQSSPELPGEEPDDRTRVDRSCGPTGPSVGTGGSDGSTLFRPPAARLGAYRILREIGRGGMGVVYEAVQEGLDRHVALKVLPAYRTPDEESIRRFRREAGAAARLHHDNIVKIHDLGEDRGNYFYAMEYVEGVSLTALCRSEPLSPSRAARLFLQVAKALDYAHDHDLIHRDIKPENILVAAGDKAYVTDFGLVKEMGTEGATQSGDVLGTPTYMSPEQAAGQSAHGDRRMDVYSLGATLYRVITGLPPFSGSTAVAVMRKVFEEAPTPLRRLRPEIPADLEQIVLKAMEKDPTRRYPTAGAMAEDLRRFTRGEPVLARPPGPAYRLHRWLMRHRAAAVATTAVMAVIAAAWGWQATRPGFLRLTSRPAGARILLDGKETGRTTPVDRLDISRGRHDLAFVLDGYRTSLLALTVTPGAVAVVDRELEPLTGFLTIEGTPDPMAVEATRYPEGAWATERFSAPQERRVLPAGDYRLRAVRPGYAASTRSVSIPPDGEERVRFSLPRRLAWRAAGAYGCLTLDTDGDGRLEVLAWGNIDVGQGRLALYAGSTVMPEGMQDRIAPLWAHTTPLLGPPAILDLDGDGTPEILIHERDRGMIVRAAASGEVLGSLEGIGAGLAPLAASFDGDDRPELLVARDDGRLVCLALPDRRTIWEAESESGAEHVVGTRVPGTKDRPPALAIVQGSFLVIRDGATGSNLASHELRSTTVHSPLAAVRIEGPHPVWGAVGLTREGEWILLSPPWIDSPARGALGAAAAYGPAALDVDGDGIDELFAALASEEAICLSLAERRVRWRANLGAPASCAPLLVAATGSRPPRAIFGLASGELLHLDAGTGAVLWRENLESQPLDVVASDVDGDGVVDLLAGCRDVNIRCLRGSRMQWRFEVADQLRAHPQVIDVDGDGLAEILAVAVRGPRENVYALAGSDGRPLWTARVAGDSASDPQAADLDGDGRPEVVLGAWQPGRVECLEGATGALRWTWRAPGPVNGPTRIADVHPAPGPEVLGGDWSGNVFCLSGRDGSVLWMHRQEEAVDAAPAVADVDGDGTPEILTASVAGRSVHLRSGATGEIRWSAEVGAGIRVSPCPTPSEDRADAMDWIAGTVDGRLVRIRGLDGGVIWSHSMGTPIRTPPAPGPDADTVLIAAGAQVRAIRRSDGEVRWQGSTGAPISAGPLAADLDGDGHAEVIAGTANGTLFVWQADGALRWKHTAGHAITGGPAVADLDGDGVPEIVFGCGDERAVYSIHTRGAHPGRPWSHLGGGPERRRAAAE